MKKKIFILFTVLFSGMLFASDVPEFNDKNQYILDRHKVQFGIWTGRLDASENTADSLLTLKRQVIKSIKSIKPLKTGSYKFPQLKNGETSIIYVPYTTEYEKQYVGLGITFGNDKNTGAVIVSSIFPKSPAGRSDIKANDLLIKVNDTTVKGLELKDVIELLKGDKGESVKLVIKRNGSLSNFTITRSTIHYKASRTRVGYIALRISEKGGIYRTWHNTNRWYKLKPSKLSLKRDWLFGDFKVSVSMSIDKPNQENTYSIALVKNNGKAPPVSSTHSYEGQYPQILDNVLSSELLNKLFPLIPSIGSPISWNTPIKSSTLPFYTNGKLIEVTANTHRGTKGAYNFMVIEDSTYLLNGTGAPINKANKEHKLDLSTEFKRTEYLKFYTHSIESNNNPILVTNKGEELPISNRRLEVLDKVIKQTLLPLNSEISGNNWLYEATLFHGSSFSKANFELSSDGFLNIKNDSLITKNIPSLKQYTSEGLKVLINTSNRELSRKEIDMQKLVAANLGNAAAQFGMGTAYYEGTRVEKNYELAFSWYKKAAIQNHIKSQYFMGLMHSSGRGVAKNPKEAFKWFLKAAKQGDIHSQYKIGLIYEGGFGVVQDFKKAAFWYKKAANRNNVIAQFQLGMFYTIGTGVTKNQEEAFNWFLKAAKQKNVDAEYKVGLSYHGGLGVVQDYRKAAFWYEKAANQNNVEAQYTLGQYYFIGRGVEKNKKEAFNWFLKAANQNHANAQYLVGTYYNGGLKEGYSVVKNFEKSVFWYEKAVSQNNSKAQLQLGHFYFTGTGVEKNSTEAFKLYLKSAKQGNQEAVLYVASSYDSGKGVKVDKKMALNWYLKAAKNGNATAMYFLWVDHQIKMLDHKKNKNLKIISKQSQRMEEMSHRNEMTVIETEINFLKGTITRLEYDRDIARLKQEKEKDEIIYQNDLAHLEVIQMTNVEAKKWLIKAAKSGYKKAIDECLKKGISCN